MDVACRRVSLFNTRQADATQSRDNQRSDGATGPDTKLSWNNAVDGYAVKVLPESALTQSLWHLTGAGLVQLRQAGGEKLMLSSSLSHSFGSTACLC